jgi:hypothetical protein
MVNTEIIFQKLNWNDFPQVQASDVVKSINNWTLGYKIIKGFLYRLRNCSFSKGNLSVVLAIYISVYLSRVNELGQQLRYQNIRMKILLRYHILLFHISLSSSIYHTYIEWHCCCTSDLWYRFLFKILFRFSDSGIY